MYFMDEVLIKLVFISIVSSFSYGIPAALLNATNKLEVLKSALEKVTLGILISMCVVMALTLIVGLGVLIWSN